MNTPLLPGDTRNDPLRQRLRCDALVQAPPFSPELHARILFTLRNTGVHVLPSDLPLQKYSIWRHFRHIAIPLAAAAAAAIITWIILQPGSQKPLQSPIVETAEKNLPSLTITPYVAPVRNAIALPAAKAFEQARYGYLDKDAQRLALFVADQIPTFSTDSPQ